jgi:hypothetical protein
MEYSERTKWWVKIILLLLLLTGLGIGLSIKEDCPIQKLQDSVLEAFNSAIIIQSVSYGMVVYDLEEKEPTKMYAWTTGYNTVREQTDSTPCISANGQNICGVKNVVACPRWIDLGTQVKIGDKYYWCVDRLATKYDDRFDISFDKDIQGALEYGKQYKEVIIYEQ